MASQVAGIVTASASRAARTFPRATSSSSSTSPWSSPISTSAEATLREADVAYKRQTDLMRKSVTSEANVDTALAKRDTAAAAVNRIKALIAQKSILAPFAGRLGIRKVELGQYVSPGLALVTLQALDPIWVDFPMPEQNIGKLKTGQTIELTVDAFPGKVFKGKITSLDARVSQETRTLLVRGTLPNPDRKLLARHVRQRGGAGGRAVASRHRAAHGRHLQPLRRQRLRREAGSGQGAARPSPRPRQQKIFVVERRFVTTGQVRDDLVAVTSGLKAGEMVVTTGPAQAQQRRPRQDRQLASAQAPA